MGVRSSTVVSDRVMSHASILKAYLINQLPYWVTEQTNFGPAENPLAISINTDTRMIAYTHTCAHTNNEVQTEVDMPLNVSVYKGDKKRRALKSKTSKHTCTLT